MQEIDIDSLYESFCARLPVNLQVTARGLACRLNLAPNADVRWSAVFQHVVTLRAPMLFAEAMPGRVASALPDASLAHMLAIIEAFGTDRLADGQVPSSLDLSALLERAASARDEALARVAGEDALADARAAQVETHESISTEQELLKLGNPVRFDDYASVSAGKQAVGLPATLALGRGGGLDAAALSSVRDTLLGVWMGLQFQDDVADWEEDAARGGAWAILLAMHRTGVDATQRMDFSPEATRSLVFRSGILSDMLAAAAAQFGEARERATDMGALTLASWLREREAYALEATACEARAPGYFVRRKKLAPWAKELFG